MREYKKVLDFAVMKNGKEVVLVDRKLYAIFAFVFSAVLLFSACSSGGKELSENKSDAIQLLNVTRTMRGSDEPAIIDTKQGYIYAVMDIAALTEEDLNAVFDYLATVNAESVVIINAARYKNAVELYSAMKEDSAIREGEVLGVQIFGTPEMVPAFYIQYRAQMLSGVHEDEEEFLSDLFYGNFENESEEIGYGYNVKAHFDEGLNVDLIPRWPVVRLPLSKGEYSTFFDKYTDFVKETELERLDLVNFSNPIFAQEDHSDDMSEFLKRMDDEFALLDVAYRLYANLDGDYPVTADVMGGFTAENMSAENKKNVMELLINAHGTWDAVYHTAFENGRQIDTELLNEGNINTILGNKLYYLDTWSCSLGGDMRDNLTTEALNGKCVGVFSATVYMSNNGVKWNVPLDEMEKSNFFYFYYCYLKALHEGCGRSEAFFKAQQSYGHALIADSVNGLRGEGNYQFGLYNLLAYHNFGVLEPNVIAVTEYECKGNICIQ